MTKKDYIVIAGVIKKESERAIKDTANRPDIQLALCEVIAYELGEVMQKDNASFDMARFETACGLPYPVIKNN